MERVELAIIGLLGCVATAALVGSVLVGAELATLAQAAGEFLASADDEAKSISQNLPRWGAELASQLEETRQKVQWIAAVFILVVVAAIFLAFQERRRRSLAAAEKGLPQESALGAPGIAAEQGRDRHSKVQGSNQPDESSERHYRELFEELPLPILEEGWSKVKVILDEIVAGGCSDLRKYLIDHPDEMGRLYDAADRFGVSEAAIRLYRAKDKEELIATMVEDVAGEDELIGYRDTIVAFYHGATTFQYESDELTCDYLPIKTRIRFSLPPKHREDWSRVLVTVEDITEVRMAEARLRQAQKMEAVGQLTGGIAHDFNNLLSVIQGNAELLAGKPGADYSCTDPILRATARGSNLTQHLLAFSRQQALRPEPIDVNQLVRGLRAILERALGETFEVVSSSSEGVWPALADANQLENALLNLAINARDAMPRGGAITIRCSNAHLAGEIEFETAEKVHGDFVLVEVEDAGFGMSEEIRAKALEPFFTTKDVGKGSGLGLAMIFGFIQQSGGHLRLESEEGKGTCVGLYLPRSLNAVVSDGEDRSSAAAQGQAQVILVVEDDSDVRAMTTNMLKDMNYEVLEAFDYASAIEVLSREPAVELVLSDVVLPGEKNGPSLVGEALDLNENLKFVFMSGYLASEIEGLDSSQENFILLRKPFHQAELAEAIQGRLA